MREKETVCCHVPSLSLYTHRPGKEFVAPALKPKTT